MMGIARLLALRVARDPRSFRPQLRLFSGLAGRRDGAGLRIRTLACSSRCLEAVSFPTIRSAAGAVSQAALRARMRFVPPGTNRDTNWS